MKEQLMEVSLVREDLQTTEAILAETDLPPLSSAAKKQEAAKPVVSFLVQGLSLFAGGLVGFLLWDRLVFGCCFGLAFGIGLSIVLEMLADSARKKRGKRRFLPAVELTDREEETENTQRTED